MTACTEPTCPWAAYDFHADPAAHGWHRAYHLMNGMNDIGPKPTTTTED
jgi:hypothetical protein